MIAFAVSCAVVTDWPVAVGARLQSGSALSTRLSPSSSTPLLQTSVVTVACAVMETTARNRLSSVGRVARLQDQRGVAVADERSQVVQLVVGSAALGVGIGRVVEAVADAAHRDEGAVLAETVVVVAGATGEAAAVDVDGGELPTAALVAAPRPGS